MPFTSGFNHAAVLTADLDRYVAFYREVFGAEVLFEMAAEEGHPRMIILHIGGGSELNVFEVPADTIIGEQRALGGRGRIDHFGLAVASLADLEQVRDRLVVAGADIGEIQQLGGSTWSLFFRDVDGTELEVCTPVEGSPAPDHTRRG